jgi:adenosylhomocysteine nucleosidase
MPSVVIAAALAWEAREIVDSIVGREIVRDGERRLWRGAEPSSEVWVLRTGIGPERARDALAWALQTVKPAVLLSTGCGGAMAPDLSIGDVVVADEVVTRNGLATPVARSWRERYAEAAAAAGVNVRSGRMLSLASIVASAEEKRRIAAETRAVAVEMEAAAIGEWAAARGVEFAAARVILDPMEMSLSPEIAAMMTPSGAVSLRKLAVALVRRPGLLRELVALGSAARRCRTSLGAVHRALVRNIA